MIACFGCGQLVSGALLVTLLSVAQAQGLDESGRQAAELLSRHYYQSAVAELVTATDSLADMQSLLVMSVALQRSSEVYEIAWGHALAAEREYLRRLQKTTGKGSHFAMLYLAENRLAAGRADEARRLAGKFLGARGVAAKYRDMARIVNARALLASGDRKTAIGLLQKIASRDPEVQAELLWARFEAGQERKQAAERIDEIARSQRLRPGGLSLRVLNRLLCIYNSSGNFARAWEALRGADIGAAVHRETLADGVQLRFYSSSLSKNIAETYRLAAMRFLSIAQKEGRYAAVAAYLQDETRALFDEFADSSSGMSAKPDALPPAYRQRAEILRAALLWRGGDRSAGEQALDGLATEYRSDAGALGGVLQMCYRLRARCRVAREHGQAALSGLEGDSHRLLQSALGLYYLSRNQVEQAMSALEAGRDKSRRNRLDGNDPVHLLELAELYRRQGKYPEHLEIYFELGKEFPAVRNIQEAVQGVYAAEHISAGDVNIF